MNNFYLLLIFLLISSAVIAAEDDIKRPPIDNRSPENLKTATFAMGCFWGPDVIFGGVEGVFKTRVGYAGGEKENPTYHNLGGHTETIQIDYDPEKISYEKLLNIFFKNHNPYQKPYGSQYKSIVFYHDEQQRKSYENYIKNNEKKESLFTEIRKYRNFYYAEFYHQKYRLQGYSNLMKEIQEFYPDDIDFINSTLAARLNHFVGAKKGIELFDKEKGLYGLKDETIDWLKNLID